MRSGASVYVTRAGLGGATIALVLACSSSSGNDSGADANNLFGGGDSGSSSSSSSGDTKHDGGNNGGDSTTSSSSSSGPPADSPCGTHNSFNPPYITWCEANAGTGGPTNVLCDDFDSDSLSTFVNYVGLFRPNLVATHWVSEFCSLHATTASLDDSGPSYTSAYTEHPYNGAPSRGAGSVAFDLFVPGAATCDGTVVTRFLASASSTAEETDALFLYVTLSDLVSSGTTATSYSLGLTAAVEATGTQSPAQTVKVTPRSQDGGWVRIKLNVGGYALANPATVNGTLAWYYEKDATAQATTPEVSTTGQLVAVATTTGAVAFDVGLIALPSGGDGGIVPVSTGCDVYIDNVVSELPD